MCTWMSDKSCSLCVVAVSTVMGLNYIALRKGEKKIHIFFYLPKVHHRIIYNFRNFKGNVQNYRSFKINDGISIQHIFIKIIF